MPYGLPQLGARLPWKLDLILWGRLYAIIIALKGHAVRYKNVGLVSPGASATASVRCDLLIKSAYTRRIRRDGFI